MTKSSKADIQERADRARHHLRLGWNLLLLFLVLGVALEAFHGLKTELYVDTSNTTRRLMWTLAHAHGTLLALVNIVFALTLPVLTTWTPRACRNASRALLIGSVLVPAGFFLGGVIIYGGDPGLPIMLVPLGAIFLFIGVFRTGRAASQADFNAMSERGG